MWRMLRRDHPRICGEHLISSTVKVTGGGSSPHMRGTLPFAVGDERARGIIPAYAGNTQSPRRTRIRWRDHPRICGEHQSDTWSRTRLVGSSPHMRGTPSAMRHAHRRTGDHPRICGEHRIVGSVQYVREGSSPHMRGTLEHGEPVVQVHGIIPAYAGNTVRPWPWPWRRGDHPRICGEHVILGGDADVDRGSSPHMRGTRNPPVPSLVPVGIIPAYAGNTFGMRWPSPPKWDHPRICGEHAVDVKSECGNTGSSPHMRGTQLTLERATRGSGIIPAYAGNTYRKYLA